MMRDLILKVRMTEEEAAMYEGRDAMVLPTSDEEKRELRVDLLGTLAFLSHLSESTMGIAQSFASGALSGDDVVKVLDSLGATAGFWHGRMDHATVLIGRAAFVGSRIGGTHNVH